MAATTDGAHIDATTRIALRALGASAAAIFLASCVGEPFEPDISVDVQQAAVTQARVIEPIELGIPHPAGLAFSPRAGTLLLVPRVPGSPAGGNTDIELVTLAADRAGTVRIAAGVTDPVNMAFDGAANRLLILHSPSQLIQILARPDGSLDPETLTRIDVRSLGLRNPQGLTVDPASGRLFILDIAGPRIVRVEADPQRGFERPRFTAMALAQLGSATLRGLAFDPATGRLHVLDPAAQSLYELTARGRVVATRDVSAFELRRPHGMTFGPSGDSTDDPGTLSLYIADSGVGTGAPSSFAASGQIIELSLVDATAAAAVTQLPSFALAAMTTASWVQTIDVSQFSPPSPDAAGITYMTDVGEILFSDSEVNEMSIFEGVNLFQMTLQASLVDTYSTTSYSREPTGVAFNPANRHVFVSDDNRKEIYEVNPGPDGLYDTSDDIVTSFDTATFGSNDPEGVTYDPDQGVLFIADGVNREVYRVAPGGDGVFGGGDDVVTNFDTMGDGLDDPEGIGYGSGFLYVVGKPATTVFRFTTAGALDGTVDISAANADKPAGLAYAPSSLGQGQMSLWITDRGVDNNSDPNENDGKVYELSIAAAGNTPPTVTITAPPGGSTFTEGTIIEFAGSANDTDDGNLTASLAWSSDLDGDIGAGGSFSTTLSLGTHTITASVLDGEGLQGSATITVTVNAEGAATIEVRVAANSDDAEERATGATNLNSSDLELISDRGRDQTVGMRFNGVTIPPGATITNASIQFQVDETSSEATSLAIEGEASDNALTFSNTDWNISSRPRTSSVAWAPVPWNTVGQAGPDQQTPNIASIIQEIVDRPGWASGNSLVIIITGSGSRVAESHNGVSAAAPLLQVDFQTGPPSPPTVDADKSTVATDATNVPADGTSVATITVTLLDAASAPVAGHTVSLAQGSGSSTISAPSGPSNTNGEVTFTVTSTTAETVTYSARDVTDAVDITQTAQVAFDALPTDADASTVTATPTAVPPDGTTTSTITVTLVDAAGAPVVGHEVSLAQTGSSAITGPSGPSDASGQVTFTVTNTTAETVTYTATDVTDAVVITQTAQVTFDAAPGGSDVIDVRVAAASDDAEESAGGSVSLGSSDLELVFAGSDQTVGMRFTGVAIPPGATIANAYVQFQVDETPSGPTSLTIEGEATDNALTFSTATGNISSRSRTASAVAWSPAPWPTVGEAGPDQQTANIASVIQELVNRPGWTSGNSLVLIITGTGERVAESYNGTPGAAPLLHVEFNTGPPPPPTDAGNSSVTATPSVVPADGTSTATITVTLMDGSNTPVVGHTVSLAQGSGGSTISAPSGPSNTNGEVRFTVTSTTAETVTYTATDVSDGVTITQTAQVTFDALPTDPGASTVTATPSVVPPDGTTTSTITVTLLNSVNVPVVDHVVSLAQGAGGSSTISAASGPSDASGQVTFTVTNSTQETVTYSARDVTDGVDITQTAQVTFDPTPPAPSVIEVRVATGSDDAEESAGGAVSLRSSDLELVFAGSNQTVGMRFTGVAIPQGATIANAYVQFQVDETPSGPTSLTIQGEATDNPLTFSTVTGNISSRPRTTAAVAWAPAPWPTVGEAGPDQQTPDIASVVQEIVNRSGWASGNSLVLIVTGTGERVAESANGAPTAAPMLHVEYSN